MASLLGAKTALTARGTPGLVTWRDLSGNTPRPPISSPFTQLHPGGVPGRRYGDFTKEASSVAEITASDMASLSATEEPFDRNEIATTDTARLSATDSVLLFNSRSASDTASLSAGETISVVISGVTLKTASDTASLSATEAVALGVSIDASDTASLSADDVAAVEASAESITVSDSADLSADDVQLLEIFAGIVEKTVSDSALLTVSESARVTEVNRIRRITFEVSHPHMTIEIL